MHRNSEEYTTASRCIVCIVCNTYLVVFLSSYDVQYVQWYMGVSYPLGWHVGISFSTLIAA